MRGPANTGCRARLQVEAAHAASAPDTLFPIVGPLAHTAWRRARAPPRPRGVTPASASSSSRSHPPRGAHSLCPPQSGSPSMAWCRKYRSPCGGDARADGIASGNREREEVQAAYTPPHRRAPRDRRAGAPTARARDCRLRLPCPKGSIRIREKVGNVRRASRLKSARAWAILPRRSNQPNPRIPPWH